VQQAEATLRFAEKLKVSSGDADVLLMGDLNAYGRKIPSRRSSRPGTSRSICAVPVADRYSYVFGGLSGYLDHALASPAWPRR
jgi:predicted extracellular nuclease